MLFLPSERQALRIDVNATIRLLAVLGTTCSLGAGLVRAQTPAPQSRPFSRASFFTNSSQTRTGSTTSGFSELTTTFSVQLPEVETSGFEYGLDVRYSTFTAGVRPARASLYEGFIGARVAGGRGVARFGHLWVNDLGSLGAFAGGLFEARQMRRTPDDGRWRLGFFGGLEPRILQTGYAPGVRKAGGYVTFDGAAARRHSTGYVLVQNGSLVERSVLTATNFVPAGRKVFIYQAAEYDLQPPVGQGHRGLAYLFATGRVLPTDRVEFQATYNRGRSVDARGLGDELLAGRPISTSAIEGLLYESIGGRATTEVLPGVRVYAGYARDRNNRDADPTGRTLVGGHASRFLAGLDLSASDSLMQRTGSTFHSRYVTLGRQVGRHVYLSGDYSTSLSVVRYSRSDGITIETRPHTTRYSGTATINLGRTTTLLVTAEQTRDADLTEFRLLSGITLRTR
jgi:hypothetical protein